MHVQERAGRPIHPQPNHLAVAVSGYTYNQLPELERAVVPDEAALMELVAQALDPIEKALE